MSAVPLAAALTTQDCGFDIMLFCGQRCGAETELFYQGKLAEYTFQSARQDRGNWSHLYITNHCQTIAVLFAATEL